MDIKKRLKIKGNRVYIPIDVEGKEPIFETNLNESWRVWVGILLVISLFVLFGLVLNSSMYFLGKLISNLIIFYLVLLVFRYFVLNERYLYKAYKNFKKYRISNGGIFWAIDNVDSDGIVNFMFESGIFIELYRSSIVGKSNEAWEFREAVSEFLRYLAKRGYNYIILSVSESAFESDERIRELEEKVLKEANENLKKFYMYEIAYFKYILTNVYRIRDIIFIYKSNKRISARDFRKDIEGALLNLINMGIDSYKVLGIDDIKKFYMNYFAIARLIESNSGISETIFKPIIKITRVNKVGDSVS